MLSTRCAPGAILHSPRRDTIPLPDRLWIPKSKRHRGTSVSRFHALRLSSCPLDQSRNVGNRTRTFRQRGSSSQHAYSSACCPWHLVGSTKQSGRDVHVAVLLETCDVIRQFNVTNSCGIFASNTHRQCCSTMRSALQ